MKTRLGLFLVALSASLLSIAQTHITVDNPATWSGEVLRPYIGQTVVFDVPMYITENAYGNYKVSPWRKFQPESHGYKGTDEYKETVRINNSCMFVIDNIPAPTAAMKEPMHRCGEKIIGLQAKVNSTNSLTWVKGTWDGNTRADLEASLPDLGDYRLLVCGFNLENYFMTLQKDGGMGAETEFKRQLQRKKVRAALVRINADIFGLVELQVGEKAIDEIMQDLNARLPERNYMHFKDAASGTLQKVDFLYDANKVEPVSNTPAETTVEFAHRKKMMCFREKATGEKFIYSINHFKSMSSDSESRRVNEAKAVIDLYNKYSKNNIVQDKDVLIMGDLNCYAFTAPIKQFIDRNYIDLHQVYHADTSYSYMYGGLTSYIDHAISNETMYRQITGVSGYHINSDEDDRYTYDKSTGDTTMFRCSDHDPVLVGLKLDSTLSHSIEPYFNGANFAQDSLSFYSVYTPTNENPMLYFDIYMLNGLQICPPTRVKNEGDLFEMHTKYYTLSTSNPNLPEELKQFLPMPAGLYILHFYYGNVVTSHKLIVK